MSDDAAHAVRTLVADTAAAPVGACAVSSPTSAVQQIVAEETTQNITNTPVCAGDTGFDTWWERQSEVLRVGDRHHEGEIRVLHAGENLDDFRSGRWIPTHCFRPDGKCVWFSAGCPGRYTNTGHRNEDLILAVIRLTTSPIFWPRSVRDFRSDFVSAVPFWRESQAECVNVCAHFFNGIKMRERDVLSDFRTRSSITYSAFFSVENFCRFKQETIEFVGKSKTQSSVCLGCVSARLRWNVDQCVVVGCTARQLRGILSI